MMHSPATVARFADAFKVMRMTFIPLQNTLWLPTFQCVRWHSTEQY
jgi:hypothetical protein